MSVYDLDRSQRKNLLRAAVIETFLVTLGFDGYERKRLDVSSLDSASVKRIANVYDFYPRIINFSGVAEMVNERAKYFDGTLMDRAEMCINIASNAHKKRYTQNGRQVSGFSKLFWFMRPNGWTIFDNRAATGLGVPRGDTVKRARRFYETLARRDFARTAHSINLTFREYDFDTLYGERVLDKFLMLAGGAGDGDAPLIDGADAFPEFIPSAFRGTVNDVVNRVVEDHWEAKFFCPEFNVGCITH